MLQLHPEFRKYLDFPFNMYFYGPYSPLLAQVYYNLPKHVESAEIVLSEVALEYGRKILEFDFNSLQLTATLAETIRFNRGRVNDEALLSLVHSLKPYYPLEKIKKALDELKRLVEEYGLELT